MITLATLAQATEQQVFDQVAKHLLQQGAEAQAGGVCKYRQGDRSCAAGCLIGDSEYSEGLEGNDWSTLVRDGYVPPHHKGLIISLQDIHDKCEPPVWRERLEALATQFNLKKGVL